MIKAQQINHYYGKEQVLYDINLEIQKGEFIALVGTSGSGKSTLLSILSTLLKPTSGTLTFDNLPYQKIKNINTFRKEYVGFVFQFHYLIEYLSVKDNITLATENQENKYLDELLKYLKIEELSNKLPNQISGGERQRAAIARALINKPKVIFADEPTGNLDSQNSQNVFALLQEVANQGTTVIVATHDTELAKMTDRICEITDGKL
ncbi:MAG TPA: ABC transporter ATP-binding protein [Campylobacterales bacterium]|nr:ABC transporter ATP-binding protein [Campylobacterales bacterium]